MSIALNPATHAKQDAFPPLRWLHNAPLDLLVGCGLWSLPVLLVAAFAAARFQTHLAVVFYGLALAVNYPHYMATIHRAYYRKDEVRRYRTFTVYVTVALALTLVAAHAFPALLPWVFTTYVFWSPWHYTGQNYGLAMTFAKRNGVVFTPALRRVFYGAFELSYLVLLVGFNVGPSSDRLVVSLGLAPHAGRIVMASLLAAFALAAGWSVFHIVRQVGVRRAAPATLPLVTQCVWFFPILAILKSDAPVAPAQYGAGALAVLHSAQYLWITTFYARRDAETEGDATPRRRLKYFTTLFLGGVALFVPGPWLASYVFKFDFTTSFLIFTALVNIHHFILDGAVWKLRDVRVAKLFIESDGGASATNALASSGARRPAFSRTLVFIPVAALLVGVAALDQARFFLGVNPAHPERLARADALNPYDSRIHLRIAGAEAAAGRQERAQSALERAVAVNPYDFESQTLLGKTLVEKREYDRAYIHYRRFLTHFPNEVDSLVNFGLLALRLNNVAEATASWERAVRLDPSQQNALLYLGDAYAKGARHADAAAAFERALVLFPKEAFGAARAPERLITLVLKIGDEYAQTPDAPKADEYYVRALTLARQAALKPLEAAALARRGEFLATRDPAAAAKTYQELLKLDAEIGDRRAAAADWHNYGAFLNRANAPAEIAYACCLMAESLLEKDDSAARRPILALSNSLAEKLGVKADEVRRDREGFANRAREWAPGV
jgi:tetratricopeptide (TPR) repeat protein